MSTEIHVASTISRGRSPLQGPAGGAEVSDGESGRRLKPAALCLRRGAAEPGHAVSETNCASGPLACLRPGLLQAAEALDQVAGRS